ncbi:MAG TPA: penicillin acylase family protein [Vitreimonas sp.]|uniref:penicillin acylase family protein n=1 Tax=Vitreimonas sp. TaxID=3069702 RepID=UPI002D42F3B4|nr:penicillin acylase family protein [Vitreimonas sp.]HYD86622.1 penicillin acylase family protein [Vitreimonas sp.]
MRTLLSLGALALAAACAPAEMAQTASVRGCDAVATESWQAGAETLTIQATAAGPDCEHAVATLVVRNSEGAVWWTAAHPTAQIMTLAGARDIEAMQTALREWIAPANNTMQSTSALPVWPENADSPAAGEFPFHVADGWDRTSYESIRADDRALFCYVQGMESLACAAAVDGRLDLVGVQQFPG